MRSKLEPTQQCCETVKWHRERRVASLYTSMASVCSRFNSSESPSSYWMWKGLHCTSQIWAKYNHFDTLRWMQLPLNLWFQLRLASWPCTVQPLTDAQAAQSKRHVRTGGYLMLDFTTAPLFPKPPFFKGKQLTKRTSLHTYHKLS